MSDKENNNSTTTYLSESELSSTQPQSQTQNTTYSLGINNSQATPFQDPTIHSMSSSQAGTPRGEYQNETFSTQTTYSQSDIQQNNQQQTNQITTNNNYYSENQVKLLDQKALNELLNVNVYQLAQNANKLSPGKQSNRKNSDDDVYVEETLQFIFDPQYFQNAKENDQSTSASNRKSGDINIKQIDRSLQSVQNLRRYFTLEVNQWNEDFDDQNDKKILRSMMDGAYADQEIDKLLETFQATMKLNGGPNGLNSLNGGFIENDIRLSESIREAIDEIKMIQRPSTSKNGILDKKRFLQRYMDIAELLDVNLTVEHLLPCLQDIVMTNVQFNFSNQFNQDDGGSEKEYVKIIFQSMSRLIDFLGASEIAVGYDGIRDHIMQFFTDFFHSDKIDETLKQEIMPDVIDLLVKVSKFMTHEDRTEKILPIILDCIRDDSDDEKRILGLELVDKLAELVGKDNCQNFLMYEIVSLQDDPMYRVRKETISRMINISKVLGKEIFIGILFPVFKKLANDQVWGVRRSAVEQLPNIANLSPIEIKNGPLIEMYKKFATDSSKWVKLAAFQYLGPFIATYEGIEPNPILVDYYISMCEQNKSMAADNEVPYHCAYNFPAVLQTLGAKSWQKLKPVYENLIKDTRWKVRRTLSFSLHEVAKILGSELAEQELMPILHHFLKDQDDVKEGAIENLPKFLQVLTPEQRESFIDQLAPQQIDSKDWRKRVVLSQQIRKYSKIFTAETVFKYYVPLFFELCQDQVAEVRKEAAKSVKNISLKLKEIDELFTEFISKLIMFKQSPKFNLRQTYLVMCESLMHLKTRQLFIDFNLMSHMCELQRDRIINVRLALAEVLFNHYTSNPNGGLVQSERPLRLMILHLKLDSKYVSDVLTDVEISMQDGDELEEMRIQQTLTDSAINNQLKAHTRDELQEINIKIKDPQNEDIHQVSNQLDNSNQLQNDINHSPSQNTNKQNNSAQIEYEEEQLFNKAHNEIIQDDSSIQKDSLQVKQVQQNEEILSPMLSDFPSQEYQQVQDQNNGDNQQQQEEEKIQIYTYIDESDQEQFLLSQISQIKQNEQTSLDQMEEKDILSVILQDIITQVVEAVQSKQIDNIEQDI